MDKREEMNRHSFILSTTVQFIDLRRRIRLLMVFLIAGHHLGLILFVFIGAQLMVRIMEGVTQIMQVTETTTLGQTMRATILSLDKVKNKKMIRNDSHVLS